MVLSLGSYWRPVRLAHLAIIPLALLLVVSGWLPIQELAPLNVAVTPTQSAGLQNHVVIGLLLGMFAIVPNRADVPPEKWRQAADQEGGRS